MEKLLQHDGLLQKMQPEKLAQLQGEVLGLFLASEGHRTSSLTEFAASVLPAIHFNQFRIYRAGKRPIGWVSWAYMTDEESSGFMAGGFEFRIDTWIGGEHLWFIDFLAPFGHGPKIADDLRNNVFPDQIGFAPDLSAGDGSKQIRKLVGVNVTGVDTHEPNDGFFATVGQ